MFHFTKHEMGQGVATSMAMIIADELGADWNRIRINFPDADLEKYRNDVHGGHGTGGSNTIIQMMPRLRQSGAVARQLLMEAAAKIAKEVLVLFEDADPAACPCKEQSGHHACGSPADDDQVRIAIRRHAATALQP